MARAIVIGGEGFIGRHLAAALMARGLQVTVVGRPKPGTDAADGVRRIDLMDSRAMARLFADVPYADVYYLAAQTRRAVTADLSDAMDTVTTEVLPLIATLDAAASATKPPRIVVRAGSIAEYGPSESVCTEDSACAPATAYGAALLAGTAYASALAPRLPFPLVTARLGLTYGPGQSTAFLAARLLNELSQGRPIRIDRPEDRRPMIHVDDVVAGLVAIACAPTSPRVVNISTNVPVTMRQLAQVACDVTGGAPDLLRFGTMRGAATMLTAHADLARRTLGWQPRIDLRDGMALTLSRASTTPVLSLS